VASPDCVRTMIQKCPHCKQDVVFSRDICPACGHCARDEERGQATYMGDEARLGLAPLYTEEMETRMNAVQRRGRIQTGLIIGLLLAPLVTLNTVGLWWLRVSLPGVLALAIAAWLCWKLWSGSRAARHLLWVAAAGLGIAGCVTVAVERTALDPVRFLAYLVFGAVYVWCAWILLRSTDLPEWLSYQRQRQRDQWW
jgi:hypothetical protein